MSNVNDLENLLKRFVEIGPVGCGVSVCKNGKEIINLCVGYADLEAKRPLKSNDIIRLFSNTKPFTAASMLTLYEKGKVLLTDPIEKYIPEFANPRVAVVTHNGTFTTRPAARSIQIRDVLSMASGLTYGTQMAGGTVSMTNIVTQEVLDELESRGSFTVREFAKEMSRVPLLFDPGTSWAYGKSLDVAAAIVEVIADMDFGEYLKKAIFDPLGMEDTFFFLPEEKKNRLARQYTGRDAEGNVEISEGLDFMYNAARKFEEGGAGLLSTMDDFSKFAAMLSMGGTLNGARVMSRNTIDLMRENFLNPQQLADFQASQENDWQFARGYGYGCGVRTMIDRVYGGSNSRLGEFGWSGAAGTWLMADPSQNLSAVYVQQVLPNLYESDFHPRLRAVINSLEEID